jgi:hypothetical protein
MRRRSGGMSRRRRILCVGGGVAVGVLLVIAEFGVWTLVIPGAAGLFCNTSLTLSGANAVPEPGTQYDEQAILFDPISTSSVLANANVSSQTDSQGYGAAFLVNAESTTGYWYQVGVAYDWGWESGYLPGFAVIYSMYAPSTASSNPTALCMERPSLLQDEPVLLQIQITSGTVLLTVSQTGPGQIAAVLFSSYGASTFEGTSNASQYGFFTGWMTEWDHTDAYYDATAHAEYTLQPRQSTSDFGIGEYNTETGATLFGEDNQQSLSCGCTQSFSYEGVTETASAADFTTG